MTQKEIKELLQTNDKARLRAAYIFAFYYVAQLKNIEAGKYKILCGNKNERILIVNIVQNYINKKYLSEKQISILDKFVLHNDLLHLLLRDIANGVYTKEMPISQEVFLETKLEKLEYIRY